MATKPIKPSTTKVVDAINLLMADHKAVKTLFKEYEKLAAADDAGQQKEALVQKICDELTVHAQVEEEIFYPAVRAAIEDDDLLDEAEVEHATAKDLIAQLQQMLPGDNLYDAKVKVLSEYIDHHVKEEEDEMFPKARKSDLDLGVLGRNLAARKETLMEELEMSGADAPPPPRAKASNGSKRASKSGV
jgi:hemerythrin superfamily protein